ncbi:MAG: type II toxin-antitoxin system Phd/YefM family antitoxin [Bryobacteraceae bacterium]
MEVNVHQAKTHLSRLIEKALLGEEVIIAKAGRPLVRLIAIVPEAKRELGTAAGQITWQEGWDLPLTDSELEEFLR